MAEFLLGELTHKVIGAAMRVHGIMGNGFPEYIYQRALNIELEKENILFKREAAIRVYYLGIPVGFRRVDFLIEEKITVELKAIPILEGKHMNQAINYLEAFNLQIGLLINFGSKALTYHRLTNKKYQAN